MRSLRGIRVLRGLPRFPPIRGGGQPAPTPGVDTTPDAFELGGPITSALFGVYYESNEIEIQGVDWASDIVVINCQYSLNGGSWTTAMGAAVNGDKIRVRVLSALGYGVTELGTLDVGGNISAATSDTFSVTTGSDPVGPGNMFDFTYPENMKHLQLAGG